MHASMYSSTKFSVRAFQENSSWAKQATTNMVIITPGVLWKGIQSTCIVFYLSLEIWNTKYSQILQEFSETSRPSPCWTMNRLASDLCDNAFKGSQLTTWEVKTIWKPNSSTALSLCEFCCLTWSNFCVTCMICFNLSCMVLLCFNVVETVWWTYWTLTLEIFTTAFFKFWATKEHPTMEACRKLCRNNRHEPRVMLAINGSPVGFHVAASRTSINLLLFALSASLSKHRRDTGITRAHLNSFHLN